MTPEQPLRPRPKPPFGGDTSTLTLMRAGPWRAQMELPGKDGAPSFAHKEPELARLILEGIERGVDIGFVGDRNKNRFGRNSQKAENDPRVRALVAEIIAEDVAAGKKAGPFDAQPFEFMAVSPIGAVPKGEGVRAVHNLSHPYGGDSVNAGIPPEPLTIGRFDQATDAVVKLGSKCWLIKLDVKAAFKQVPVRPEDRPLLGLKWEGKWYYELVLPFGLRTSGHRWEMYATALHYFIEHHIGVDFVVHYVDDYLLIVSDKERAKDFLAQVTALCAHLGVPMADKKTEGPKYCLTFLGIELDTEKMEARLSATRLAELQKLLSSWDDTPNDTFCVKDLESLVGKLQFACNVVRPGRTYLRRLIDLERKMKAAQVQGNWSPWRLDDDARADIRWWRKFIVEWNGKSLLYELEWTRAPKLLLYTDACERGYGARFGDRWFRGEWSEEMLARATRDTKVSVPFLELHTLVHAATVWGPLWAGKKVVFQCDAEAAFYAVNKMTSRSPDMAELLRLLSSTAAKCGFDFRCEHIPGVTNVIADLLSRPDLFSVPALRRLLPSANAQPCPAPLPRITLQKDKAGASAASPAPAPRATSARR